jgi:hypothetical protein
MWTPFVDTVSIDVKPHRRENGMAVARGGPIFECALPRAAKHISEVKICPLWNQKMARKLESFD